MNSRPTKKIAHSNHRLIRARSHTPHFSLIKCSINDYFSFRTPVSVLFFYHEPIPEDLIIDSLEHVLGDFPLFSGRITKHNGNLYIDCNNQGIQLQVTHSDQSLIKQLSQTQSSQFLKFVNILNPKKTLKQARAVFTIKLSYHPDGMAMGIGWHHSIGDMSTVMQLLQALSSYTKKRNYPLPQIEENRQKYLGDWIRTQTHIPLDISPCSLKRMNWIDLARFICLVISPKKTVYLYFSQSEMRAMRADLSSQASEHLSNNASVCGHLLNIIARCRGDTSPFHYASIIVNQRLLLGMSSKVLGNFADLIHFSYSKSIATSDLAKQLHLGVKKYVPKKTSIIEDFVHSCGGVDQIKSLIPGPLLPQNKNLMISNLSSFNAYSIDFGISSPFLFLPVGKSSIPWVSCITKGFNNKGLLIGLVLPSNIVKKITSPTVLEQIHQYRNHLLPEEATTLTENPWCK